jgi:hypothetical protein
VAPPPPAPEPLPYRLRDDFLSRAEASFYRVLKGVVGEHLLICPKVSLDDIFFVAQPDQHRTYWNKINRKHVDFLLVHPDTLRPVAALELDDASHQRDDRIARDRFVEEVFAVAHLPLLRVPVRLAYNPADLTALLRTTLAPAAAETGPAHRPAPTEGGGTAAAGQPPACPTCGVPMVRRTAQRGAHAGREFYGCPNYPQCRQMLPVAA